MRCGLREAGSGCGARQWSGFLVGGLGSLDVPTLYRGKVSGLESFY